MTPAEEAAYLAGATWGINAGRRQIEDSPLECRRIVAMLLQHQATQELVASVLRTEPINWRERLQPDCEDNPVPHDLWPAGFESEDA